MMDSFDKQWNKMQRRVYGGMIFGTIILTGVLVFLGWVVVKIMQHFGVV